MDLPFGACRLVLGIQWVARRLAKRRSSLLGKLGESRGTNWVSVRRVNMGKLQVEAVTLAA